MMKEARDEGRRHAGARAARAAERARRTSSRCAIAAFGWPLRASGAVMYTSPGLYISPVILDSKCAGVCSCSYAFAGRGCCVHRRVERRGVRVDVVPAVAEGRVAPRAKHVPRLHVPARPRRQQ
jgi:hypothetical protein